MDEKITKKNSILYNQLWTIKAIEDGHIEFFPCRKSCLSIGEQIERKYQKYLFLEEPKITKKTSILFNREWILKAKEDGVKIPRPSKNYSIGEELELLYFARELLNRRPDPEDILKLKKERVVKQ